MSQDKNNRTDKEKIPGPDKDKLDKQLDQTFPASDPPKQTRPGHTHTEEDEEQES